MKIDRLLSITILLLNRGRISAKELAERFEVSTKTIYRDIETLNQSGIPIVSYQGLAGGFEIMEEYTISRQFLTLREITAIVTAVKGMNSAIDDRTLDGLLEKVRALLGKMDRAESVTSGAGMIFDFNPWNRGAEAQEKFNRLREAIEASTKVQITYVNSNGNESERLIEPANLILKGNVWYLQAYCTLKKEFRVFRLSRILEIEVLNERFGYQEAPSLESYEWNAEWTKGEVREITLIYDPAVRYRLADSFSSEQIRVLENGFAQVTSTFTVDEWFYGMLLSYGDHVRVEQPKCIAQEHVRRAKKIMELYINQDI
ncbi:YafY family transcriptional regulator [Neobacillus mesonae]|nr:YafY family transcriptional regulator [Neobacillus mesonae]